MGPRSRDRGISFYPKVIRSSSLLQWGRGHVTAESGRWLDIDPCVKTLQWGRGHVTAESQLLHECQKVRIGLQWGRGHVTAESPSGASHFEALQQGFNGAAVT